jgi:hypothetical protein
VDDDYDDDDDGGDDVVAPVCLVVKMAISSLPIPPPDDLRRLGFFYLLDEFLVHLCSCSPDPILWGGTSGRGGDAGTSYDRPYERARSYGASSFALEAPHAILLWSLCSILLW